MAGVKNKIELFEKTNTVNTISRETKVSHGAIPKDKPSQEKSEVKPRPAPPLTQRSRHSVIIGGQSKRKFARFLSQTDLTQTANNTAKQNENNIEEVCKLLLKGNREEATTEDLLHDLWVIEKLREAYVEKIEEKAAEAVGEGEDEAIYENVRSLSTQNFVATANRWDSDEEVGCDKMQHLIQELINTEEKYVSDLEKIVKHYIPYFNAIELPLNLAGKQHNLFGNILQIFGEASHFICVLTSCGYDHEKIAEAFIKFEFMFQLYPVYSKNKPNADRYLPEFQTYASCKQKELGDRLDLRSYLVAPIQRLGKYLLFLKGIDGQLIKTNTHSIKVERALNMVKKVIARADDYVAIGSIKFCPIDLNKVGALVLKTKFLMRTNKIEQNFETMVYLFEDVIVFTIESFKEKEAFSYFDSLQLSDLLVLPAPPNEPLAIKLEDYSKSKTPNKEQCIYILTANTANTKEIWKKKLEERLWEQANKHKDEINAQYNGKKLVGELQQKLRGIARVKTSPAWLRKP